MIIDRHSNRFLIRWVFISIVLLGCVAPSFSNPATVDRIVDVYGQLRVEGNKIVDQNGNPIVLRGMSLFWSQWIGKYYNYDCVQWLHEDWQCTVVRAALAVESGGYLTYPEAEKNKVKAVIDACIDLGIYVIVDWHDHNAQNHTAKAIEFFSEISAEYGYAPNIIYEIYNEPLQVSWPNVIKPYADSVITEIRANDPDNIIVVGTPTWSQDVDIASATPIVGTNIAYALHFYAGTHTAWLRAKATTALNRGVALWVTEFGTCESSGTGPINYTEMQLWFDYMEANKLSWCNWSLADKAETSAALIPGASVAGGWAASDLTASGTLIRNNIISRNEAINAIRGPAAGAGITTYNLAPNYPNPFNPATTIEFSIPKPDRVHLSVVNVLGEEISTLVDGTVSAGSHQVEWNATDYSSGVYFYRMRVGNFVQTRKMLLVR